MSKIDPQLFPSLDLAQDLAVRERSLQFAIKLAPFLKVGDGQTEYSDAVLRVAYMFRAFLSGKNDKLVMFLTDSNDVLKRVVNGPACQPSGQTEKAEESGYTPEAEVERIIHDYRQ